MSTEKVEERNYFIDKKNIRVDIIPHKHDTKLSEIKYEEKILIVVKGKVVKRFYKEIFCQRKGCDNQILARYVKCGDSYTIIQTGRHNESKCCSPECRGSFKHEIMTVIKESRRNHVKTKVRNGYPAIPITMEQAIRTATYIARL